MNKFILLVIIILIIVLIYVVLYKLIDYICYTRIANKTLKQAELITERKKLEYEINKLKGFPFIKVTDVKVGQFVSNADSIYLCIDYLPDYKKRFFDFTNGRIIDISFDELVRKRADLDDIMSKEKEVKKND